METYSHSGGENQSSREVPESNGSGFILQLQLLKAMADLSWRRGDTSRYREEFGDLQRGLKWVASCGSTDAWVETASRELLG